MWFGLVWIFNFDLVWGLPWGSPALPAPFSPHCPPQLPQSCLPQTMDGQEKKKKKNGVGYRVAAQLKSHHNQICIFLDSWAWRVRAAGRAAPPQSPASWTGASPPSTLAWLGPPATHPGWPAATPPSTARAVSPPPRSPAPTPAWQQPACSGRARPLCSLSTRPRLPAPGRSSGQQSSH